MLVLKQLPGTETLANVLSHCRRIWVRRISLDHVVVVLGLFRLDPRLATLRYAGSHRQSFSFRIPPPLTRSASGLATGWLNSSVPRSRPPLATVGQPDAAGIAVAG